MVPKTAKHRLLPEMAQCMSHLEVPLNVCFTGGDLFISRHIVPVGIGKRRRIRRGNLGFTQRTRDNGWEIVDVGRRTWDVGMRTWGVGRRTWDVGRKTGDVGRKTGDVGRRTGDVGRRTGDVGRRTGGNGKRVGDGDRRQRTTEEFGRRSGR